MNKAGETDKWKAIDTLVADLRRINMCVDFVGKWAKAKKDIIAWKVVRKIDGKYYSPRSPDNRFPQYPGGRLGNITEYIIGKQIKTTYPGYYLYTTREWARKSRICLSDIRIMKLLVPKGTLVRYSSSLYFRPRNINALSVIPLEIAR